MSPEKEKTQKLISEIIFCAAETIAVSDWTLKRYKKKSIQSFIFLFDIKKDYYPFKLICF